MIKKPNILFLTIDTLRADWVGCYGHPKSITPNIDRLAQQSIRFSQAITGGSWTQAAFPVMMTSTYASMYGGCLGPLSTERPSPVETFSQNGYSTAAFSTSPLLSKIYGYDRGFDQFSDMIPNEKDPALRHMKGGQRLLRYPITHQISNLFGVSTRPAKIYVNAKDLTDVATAWLRQADEPFLMWVHYMDVHWPYHKEEELEKAKDIAQAWNDVMHLHEVNFKDGTVSAEQRQHYIELYEQAIQYTDAQIGRLLDHLEQTGVMEDTIIVIVSDHGEEFLERGYWGHVEINLYDEILKVPMIFKLPGQTTAQVIPQQVRTLDIMPTLLELCDIAVPDGMEGSSLQPLWSGNEDDYEAAPSISERWRDDSHLVAMRTADFKYIWNSEAPHQPQLFNLKADPAEKHNVAIENVAQANQFQKLVDDYLIRMASTMPQTAVLEPELDDDVLSRLRDLGYVE